MAKAAHTEVAKPAPQGVVKYEYGDHKGEGWQNTSDADFAVPFLSVLQAGSPEVTNENGKGLEGAKPGTLMDTVSKDLYDGSKGVVMVPCVTQHCFVEWKPRASGGGYVAMHPLDSPVVKRAKDESKEFGKYKTPDGNDLVETFYIWGMMLEDVDALEPLQQLVLAFTSTKIKKYKKMMSQLRMVKEKPPLYANRLIVKSCDDKNSKGAFKNFALAPAKGSVRESLIPPTGPDGQEHPILLVGKELMESVFSGAVRAAHESTNVEAQTAGETPF